MGSVELNIPTNKLSIKEKIKSFIKSPHVFAPILAYLILLGPTLYLYSGSPPETETEVYKGAWCVFISPNLLAGLKDIGVNTVQIGGASNPFEFPAIKELVVANIQTAHRNGFKVFLTLSGSVSMSPTKEKIRLETLNSRIIEYAKIVEELGVEFFAPLNEPEFINKYPLEENIDPEEWAQDILPKVKEVYHGEVIWRGDELFRSTDYSGYDYIGFTASPVGMAFEDYPEYIDTVLDEALEIAERDNCKGVMITEFFAWEHEPGHSKEEVARAFETAFERGENKAVGFFPTFLEFTMSRKVMEMIERWYKEML